MRKQIVWKGLYYQMMEYCNIETTETDIRIDGTIVGFGEDEPFSVNYDIVTDSAWQVAALEMAIEKGGECTWISIQRDPDGKWTQSGHARPEWEHCIDIDISLTPFTNTLPINRLKLPTGEKHHLDVLYINVLKNEVKPVEQFYTRLAENTYLYEGVFRDFKAELLVDEDGVVIEYPSLFSRIQS
ncbi:putative glycolipid-binding domain-containing protein [Chitinophaga sp.]|uniref:putative glycolipid-binding domain-containing protein n=1 Tax=Chitinophaga sp. TaxID=1869181 RepID=UPI0031CEE867